MTWVTRDTVNARVAELLARVPDRRVAKPPNVFVFDLEELADGAYGTTFLDCRTVLLDSVCCFYQPDFMLDIVLPHELAHALVADAHGGTSSAARSHGEEWQAVMKAMGAKHIGPRVDPWSTGHGRLETPLRLEHEEVRP